MEWVKVAEKSDFVDKRVLQIEVDDELLAIYHLDGDYYALSDICSHAEAYLSEGEFDDGNIVCPLHGAKFDIRSGKNQSLPAVTPVDRYDIKLDGDNILVGIED